MAAFALAGIDLGSTLGVTFLGVALSSMYVSRVREYASSPTEKHEYPGYTA